MIIKTKSFFSDTPDAKNKAKALLKSAGVPEENIVAKDDYTGDLLYNVWAEAQVTEEKGARLIEEGSRYWSDDANGFLSGAPLFFEK